MVLVRGWCMVVGWCGRCALTSRASLLLCQKNCSSNKDNRGKVLFGQKTGSRCYIAHAHVVKDKYKDVESTAIDLFKEFHCSRLKGYSEPVKKAIDDMESLMAEPVEEGHLPKSPIDALSQVVPSFFKNAGIMSSFKKSFRIEGSSQLQELQSELEIERKEKGELKQQIDTQREELDSFKMQASEATAKQADEIESLKATVHDLNSVLRQLLTINCGQVNLDA